MKLHRSEIIFLAYVAVMAMAAAFVIFVAGNYMDQMSSLTDNKAMLAYIAKSERLIAFAWSIVAITVLFGVFGVYPSIRKSVNEQGRLSLETETLTKKSQTFQHAALTDPLTGLQNRRYFDDALDQYVEQFAAINHPLGVIVLDLDHFKKINDTYGHDIGDDVLRGVTKCLLDFTRYHDVVARIGGEEFAILAPNLDQRSLQRLADRIRVAISEITFESDNVRFRVTTSMGIAMWDGTESTASFVKRADKNLYEAKTSGRNRAVA